MKHYLYHITLLAATLFATTHATAQTDWNSVFTTLKLEARADAEAISPHTANADTWGYGMQGRYFDVKMGGDLGGGFSYFMRQNIRANKGDIHFFDNTDFLWLNYQINPHWRVRFGKDAMAVGGYEYDAPPIDEYLVSEYWNNFYCFQLATSVAYTWNDGNQQLVAQVSQSPYVNSRSLGWDAGLLAYNIEWLGSLGNHVRTLWSTSMIERSRGTYMNLTMLGTQLVFDRFDLYLDLMHHSLTPDDFGKNYGLVARFNYHCDQQWHLFAKASYETNQSEADITSGTSIDNLVEAGHTYAKGGLGCEWYPKRLSNVRLHAYVGIAYDKFGQTATHTPQPADEQTWFCCNLGATWHINFADMLRK